MAKSSLPSLLRSPVLMMRANGRLKFAMPLGLRKPVGLTVVFPSEAVPRRLLSDVMSKKLAGPAGFSSPAPETLTVVVSV
jgi:hypothetical protein